MSGMGQRYLVSGQMGGWFIFGRVLGPLIMVSGLFLMPTVSLGGGIAVFIGGAILCLIMEVQAFIKRTQRVWIEVLPDGFLVADRHGEREHRDHEVVSIAYSTKINYSNGEPSGYTRKSRFWFKSAPEVVMDSTYGNNVNDPVWPLIERILNLLKAGYAAALQHGIAVSGDGWELSKAELRCKQQGREQPLSLADITAVETYEGKMGIWIRGNDIPVITFPIDGRNTWLLPALLEPYITPETTDGPPAVGLGRVLFSRKSSRSTVIGCIAGSILCGVIGLPLLCAGAAREPAMAVAGVIALVLVPVFALCAWYCAVAQFRCHEWGVFQAGMTGQRQLLYRDVGSFSYSATRHYHNGVYTGTQLALSFVPLPGCGPTMSYNTSVQGGDDDLENLKDFVSRVIAGQMSQRLAGGEEVRWTNNLTFRPDGIIYRPSGWVGRKEPVFLPYEQYGGYNLDQGVFYLFAKGAPKAVMNEGVSEANFFPGFYLLLMLLHQAAETEESAAE